MPGDSAITPASVWSAGELATPSIAIGTPTLSYILPRVDHPGDLDYTPTPDQPHFASSGPRGELDYIVKRGDILSAIAEAYNVSIEAIVAANDLKNPDMLEVGQKLIIPATEPRPIGPDFKIIPDSELVFGPLAESLDVEAFLLSKGGYLAAYTQEIDGAILNSAQIVSSIARDYSVNPRLLLALVEYRSGWLTDPSPDELTNPFGYLDDWYVGLYRQLAWASIQLNSGFYRWRDEMVTDWYLTDGSAVPASPIINAGTAGIQHFFARLDDHDAWMRDVTPGGFYDIYYMLFGSPFALTIEPLVPDHLIQPVMQLPFGSGEVWAFTGGPHFSWDAGTPFGALDFAPPGEAMGCVSVENWVAAVADGTVARTGTGIVILDLDLDGNEGTGWVVLYMHIENRDRVESGKTLQAGDAIGHPSCEGGLSSGTHVHLARKFNGTWIAADGKVPFLLDGWMSSGTGEEYVGSLKRGSEIVEAFEGNSPINLIQR